MQILWSTLLPGKYCSALLTLKQVRQAVVYPWLSFLHQVRFKRKKGKKKDILIPFIYISRHITIIFMAVIFSLFHFQKTSGTCTQDEIRILQFILVMFILCPLCITRLRPPSVSV